MDDFQNRVRLALSILQREPSQSVVDLAKRALDGESIEQLMEVRHGS